MQRWLIGLPVALVLLVLVLLCAGQFGLLQGPQPDDLGVREGRLKPPSTTPNSVSSQAGLHAGHPRREEAAISPLPMAGSPAQAIARLRAVVASMPGGRVIESRDDYLYAQFRSRWFGFVDDVEFWADPAEGVVHVRSASRVGRRDLDVNRRRIEAIRDGLQR